MTSVFSDIRPAPEANGACLAKGTRRDQPTPTEAFGLCGTQDIFAPLPPIQFLVDGAIPTGSLVLLTGYGGDRKSWLALALAIACATGSTWLGLSCTAGEAVVLDYENAFNSTKRRIQRLARGHGHPIPISGLDLGRPKVSLSDNDFASTVESLLQERPNMKLIIIDTLRAACPGIDENASTIREHIDRLRSAAEKHGVVIVFLAHARKASINNSGASQRERIRGSSALFDAVDVVFGVTAAKDGALSIQQTKGREAKDYLHLSARLVDTPSGDIRLELTQHGLDQAVLTAVSQRPGCSIAELLPVVKTRKEDVSAAVHRLLSNGLLVNRGSGKPFRLHVSAPVPKITPGMYPHGGSPGGSPIRGEPRNQGTEWFPEPVGTTGTTGA